MLSSISVSLGWLAVCLRILDSNSQVEMLIAQGWSLSCKNDICRVIPDFSPSDEQVSSRLSSFLLLSPGRMPAMGLILPYEGRSYTGLARRSILGR